MLSIKTILTGTLPDYSARLSRFIISAAWKIRARMREKLHEKKSGRIYERKRGGNFTRGHQASAEGEAPASDSGALDRSLTIVRRATLEAAIESALGYPGILEDEMKRPMWQASLDESLPMLENDLIQAMS